MKQTLLARLAFLMALILVLGTSIPAFAADDLTPKVGGTLHIGTGQAPGILGYTPDMPRNAHILFLRTAFESLLFYHEDGSFAPQLATEWSADPEACTLTFKLREGVKFSDGTDFNAEAVKWNIGRYQAKGRTEVGFVDTVECTDELTVIFHLKSWNSASLEAIGFFVCYMSPTAVEANGDDWARQHTVGTGPFMLTEWEQGVSMKYERNPYYWQEGKPYLDAVTFTTILETATMENALRAGDIDLVCGAPLDLVRSVEPSGEFILMQNANGVCQESTGIIPSSIDPDSPFYDARVRKAMAMAIDADTLVQALGYGYLTRTNQWAAPGASTYNPNLAGATYDPEQAKALLAEAGYADGFDTVIYGEASRQNWMVVIADQLTAVGIRTTVEVVDSAKVTELMTNGWEGIDFHTATISPDLGLYMGRHLDPDGAYFAKGIQHPQDALELLAKIRTATDDAIKQQYSWELQSLIYDDYTLFGLPLYVTVFFAVKHPYVMGDNATVYTASSWTPADAWLNR